MPLVAKVKIITVHREQGICSVEHVDTHNTAVPINWCIQYMISCANMIAAIGLPPCCRLVLTALTGPFQGSLVQKEYIVKTV